MSKMMLGIAQTDLCNGCNACFSVCPMHAITMKADSEGFLRPSIYDAACTQCGSCEKVCPVLNRKILAHEFPKAYACYNTDEEIRKASSSGGMFSLLAKKILSENGIVFGARFSSDFAVVHGWTDSIEGLADFRGSKYVQSEIGSSFIECKRFLKSGRRVLFSGTPCQIAGLLNYLGRPYENLLCVDFICHGVPSPALWGKYCGFREAQAGSRIASISFRRKDCGWKRYSLAFSFINACEYHRTLDKDPYMQLFLRNVCLRPSCYQCSFKGVSREADITLADFWGVQRILPDIDDDKGISLLLVHSDKGRSAYNIIDSFFKKEVDFKLAISENPAIQHSVIKPAKRISFFSYLAKKDFQKVIKTYSSDSFWMRVILLLKVGIRKVKRIIFGVAK
jgi:ferredoxin